MNPALIDSMSAEMAEVYGAVTDKILINLAKYFRFAKDSKEVMGSFEYQTRMLAQMGQINRETVEIIRQGLNGGDAALQGALESAIVDALKHEDPKLRNAAMQGMLNGPKTPEVTPNQMQAFQAYYKQSADKMNLVNTVMLESTQAAYSSTVADIANRINRTQSILNVATGEVVTGVSSWNQAMRDGVRKMVDNGLTGFIDHAGRRWSPEAYVAMDIRTTMFNTSRAAVWERAGEYGCDTYQVSSHSGARPLCYPWQGKVISRNDLSREIEDLDGNTIHVYAQSETTIGKPAGLFGINCRHYPMTFIPGFSTLRGEPQDEETNARVYEESQEQRGLERKLRAEKRDLAVLKAQGADADTIRAQKAKVDEASNALDEFCDRTGRTRRKNREGTPIKAHFPDKDSYNPSAFPTTTRDQMHNWFQGANTTPQPVPEPWKMEYGKPFDIDGASPKLKAYTREAKEALDNAPENIRHLWSNVSNDLKSPDFGNVKGAYYDPYSKRTFFESQKMTFTESDYQRKNTVFFHEYGHNIDNLLSPNGRGFYSHKYKDNAFGKSILKECEERVKEFYLQKNGFTDVYDAIKHKYNQPGELGFAKYVRMALRGSMPVSDYNGIKDALIDADDSILRPLFEKHLSKIANEEFEAIIHSRKTGNDFVTWVNKNYSLYQRADISDMFQKYTVEHYAKPRPFYIGHKYSYFDNEENLPTEAFAEMFSATIADSDSLPVIKEFFPESYKIFEEMIEEALK